MRNKTVKLLRKYSKRNWIEYVQAISEWPFSARWRLCWHILFAKRKDKR